MCIISAVTFATWITTFRIVLVPVFAILVGNYARSDSDDPACAVYRIAALWVFLVAAISDAVDGFIARYFRQRSRLGELLDPIADKLLVLTALISLSLGYVQEELRFPLWFTILIISKDILIVLGCYLIHLHKGVLKVRPNIPGKITTALLLVLITGALWQPGWLPFALLLCVTAFFALWAFYFYLSDMFRQLQQK